MLELLLPVLVQAAAEPPRTVNDIVIGEPDDFVTAGPASVCMREMVVTPRSGEKAYLTYSGIHNGSIRLVLADGDYVEFTYGEIFLDRHSPDQGPMIRTKDMRVYYFENGPEVSYQVLVEPKWEWSDGGWEPLVNVQGSALGGNRFDRDIFRRLSFDWEKKASCDRRYNFGWEVILGDETIDATKTQ